MDRLVGTHFYNAAEGGDAFAWQHLFWFFGHPEVYIIFIPALGIVSSVVSTFARRAIFAYPLMVLALIAIGFLAFACGCITCSPPACHDWANSFYTAPAWSSRCRAACRSSVGSRRCGPAGRDSPARCCSSSAFVVVFVLGGLTGVMLASVPLDLQLHDTYFVVAHFHYVAHRGRRVSIVRRPVFLVSQTGPAAC